MKLHRYCSNWLHSTIGPLLASQWCVTSPNLDRLQSSLGGLYLSQLPIGVALLMLFVLLLLASCHPCESFFSTIGDNYCFSFCQSSSPQDGEHGRTHFFLVFAKRQKLSDRGVNPFFPPGFEKTISYSFPKIVFSPLQAKSSPYLIRPINPFR
jgi:hypothetical protein